jgi:hypothetical protein
MRRPGVRAEVARIEREEAIVLEAPLKARQDTGLTQPQVADRIEGVSKFVDSSR